MHWLSSIVGLCHFSMKTIDSRLWHQNLSYTFDIQTCWLLELAIHFIALSIRSRWCMVVVYFENATLNCFGIYVYVVAVVAAVCDMPCILYSRIFPIGNLWSLYRSEQFTTNCLRLWITESPNILYAIPKFGLEISI